MRRRRNRHPRSTVARLEIAGNNQAMIPAAATAGSPVAFADEWETTSAFTGTKPLSTRDLFARHNIRCTTQRIALYDALLAAKNHPTAEELFRLVKPQTPRLSLATVYNTLEVLCSAGLCRRLPTSPPRTGCRYDADTTDHLHVRIKETGEIRDVPPALGARLIDEIPRDVLAEIERRLGLRIDGISVQLVASLSRSR